MGVQVAIDLPAKKGKFDELREWMVNHIAGTRNFNGNMVVESWRNQDKPDSIFLLEKWESRADFEKYLQWREETGVITELLELLDGEPAFHYFDPLGV
ncbi:antibiotic biosynthesis monooxygenase [Gordonia sp. X0973]|uniref:putative quinol monooxygenase n=1 Tax=Gordonia sp. X0973 TaxID=2742602 RepID=UPI000F53E369|nr:antibiotic biosynthesis monooxygenase [Gordonia sp. X0973]QKT08471.1 antibiotic biosynthesis monooxygenase [Gordonia sp. X0973]